MNTDAHSLADLDAIVLVHILARLPDPLPLASTCKVIHGALHSPICCSEWFSRWQHPSQREPVYAAITWRATRCYTPSELLRLLLPNQHLQSGPSSRRHIEELQQLGGPWQQHLLLMAAAAGNPGLLQSLLLLGQEQCQEAAEISGLSLSDTAHHHHHKKQQQQQQQQQEMDCFFLQPLPPGLRLPSERHDLLQSALVSAARAGQLHSLQALLKQLLHGTSTTRTKAARLDLLLEVAEVAAAAGHLCCMLEVFEAMRGMDMLEVFEAMRGMDEVPACSNCGASSSSSSSSSRKPGLLGFTVSSSTYIVAAAAASGSSSVLSAVLSLVGADSLSVKQQLPAALVAAGQRGHLDVLQQLLQLPVVSSRPLQIAASDAAFHGWPAGTLQLLLDHLAAAYRIELLQLLARPLQWALQYDQPAVASAMFNVLQREAVTEQPELLQDVLMLLAQQGQTDGVSWVLRVAPTVLVRLGPRAAAAALEAGHEHVAQLILDAGGERPTAYKAAAKRGQLVAAVRDRNVAAVRELLHEVSLPLVWTCESGSGAGSGSSGGVAVHAHVAAAVATSLAEPIALAAPSRRTTSCLLSLLKAAATAETRVPAESSAAGGASAAAAAAVCSNAASMPVSCQLLQLLLAALPPQLSTAKRELLVALAEVCVEKGRRRELQAVLDYAQQLPPEAQSNVLRNLIPYIQLPPDRLTAQQYSSSFPGSTNSSSSLSRPCSSNSCSSSSSDSEPDLTNAAESATVATALWLLEQPGSKDLLCNYVCHPYLSTVHPRSYLGVAARPQLPGAFIPCRRGLTQLFRTLAAGDHCPPGARVKQVEIYKLMVRAVLQASDLDLLHAFLSFMHRHGEEVLSGLPRNVADLDHLLLYDDD